jgi:perosamine synthetase
MEKDEINNVIEVLKSGMLAQGTWVKEFENIFSKYLEVKQCVATSSGTTALDVTLKGLDIKKDDEILVPDFSFISTANSVLFQGAKPVFIDVDENFFTINPDDIVKKITPKTKAIIGVHLFGQPFELDKLIDICKDKNIILIEDCAQAHGAEFEKKKVGSFGIGCFSFYATKNITTGEGGIISTNNEELNKKFRLLINHGQIKKYLHNSLGYNFRMTNIQAALGLAQIKKLDKLNKIRVNNAKFFNKYITNKNVIKPKVRKNVSHVYHQYVLKIKSNREEFIKHLTESNIGTSIHYPMPIHMQPLYQRLNYPRNICPISNKISKEVVSIPVHPALSKKELENIVNTINSW